MLPHPFATFITQPFGPHPQNATEVEYQSFLTHAQTKKSKMHRPPRMLAWSGLLRLGREAQSASGAWAVGDTVAPVFPRTLFFVEARTSSLRLEATEALDRYSGYSKGWDGYDGEMFEAETIEKARRAVDAVLSHFRTIPLAPDDLQTGPAGDGSIDVDTTFNGKKLLVTIYSGPEGLHVSLEEGGTFDRAVGSFDEAALDRWLDRLTSQGVLHEPSSTHSEAT